MVFISDPHAFGVHAGVVVLSAVVITVLPLLVYVIFRFAGMGWYRSKLEHFRKVKQETRGEDRDG